MNTTKLTLSANKQLVHDAKRIAHAHGTSVSAMFARFIRALEVVEKTHAALGPITQQAAGIIRISPKLSKRDFIEEALHEKYR